MYHTHIMNTDLYQGRRAKILLTGTSTIRSALEVLPAKATCYYSEAKRDLAHTGSYQRKYFAIILWPLAFQDRMQMPNMYDMLG